MSGELKAPVQVEPKVAASITWPVGCEPESPSCPGTTDCKAWVAQWELTARVAEMVCALDALAARLRARAGTARRNADAFASCCYPGEAMLMRERAAAYDLAACDVAAAADDVRDAGRAR